MWAMLCLRPDKPLHQPQSAPSDIIREYGRLTGGSADWTQRKSLSFERRRLGPCMYYYTVIHYATTPDDRPATWLERDANVGLVLALALDIRVAGRKSIVGTVQV